MVRSFIFGRIAALSLSVFLTALVVLPNRQAPSADGVGVRSRGSEPSLSLEKARGRRIIEGFQTDPLKPSHWKLILDDPVDGQGQVFRFETTAYLAVNDLHPSVMTQFSLIPGVEPTTMQEAVAYIVATYAHVTSPADLEVRKLDITTP